MRRETTGWAGGGGTEEMKGVGGVFGGGVYVCASHMHVLFEWKYLCFAVNVVSG